MLVKTSDLTGPALDWAVAKCEGGTTNPLAFTGENRSRISESWATCGPIIEREGIGLDFYGDGGHEYGGEWGAATNEGTVHALGRTPLVAAMRCFVASKLGDEVEVPDTLR